MQPTLVVCCYFHQLYSEIERSLQKYLPGLQELDFEEGLSRLKGISVLDITLSRINHTVILDDLFDNPAGLPVPDRSPEPTQEQLDSGRIGADEVINNKEKKDAEELDELMKGKEAKEQAVLMEMVGDLPDADI